MRIRLEIGPANDRRLPIALAAYALGLGVFLLVPPYLKPSVGPPVGFTQQEAADLLTPLVVIPLAWWVLELASGGLGRRMTVAFILIAALWIEGQGIHLAANAIGDAFGPHGSADTFYATVPGDLDLWLDETLSHWMWHVAWVLLSALMLWVATVGLGAPTFGAEGAGRTIAGVAGFLHGATFFVVSVEGVTTALGIPATVIFLGWSAVLALRGAHGTPARPVVDFFLVASLTTLVGYVGWAALHGWTLPEFSTVGLFS